MKTTNSKFTSKLFMLLFLVAMLFSLQNCDVTDTDAEEDAKVTDTLFVKFENDEASVATVFYFSYQTMGKASESTTPTGDWSANVLENNQLVVPAGSAYFTLKIPNLHWARYHLGIIDADGNEILLHEQANYQESNTPVTHWGADTRTISTKIIKNETTGTYHTSGYSDWAGID